MKLVNEKIGDVLKPKNQDDFNGKIYYYESSATRFPEYMFKVMDFNFKEKIVACIVIYNNHMVSGGMDQLELDEDTTFNLNISQFETFLSWNNMEELTKVPDKMEQQISELNDLKRFIEALIS